MHEEPVYVDPHRSTPIPRREEGEAVPIVARYRREAFIRETKPGVLQAVNHATRLLFVGYTCIQGHEVATSVSSTRYSRIKPLTKIWSNLRLRTLTALPFLVSVFDTVMQATFSRRPLSGRTKKVRALECRK